MPILSTNKQRKSMRTHRPPVGVPLRVLLLLQPLSCGADGLLPLALHHGTPLLGAPALFRASGVID